jgi:hypothetical protein
VIIKRVLNQMEYLKELEILVALKNERNMFIKIYDYAENILVLE